MLPGSVPRILDLDCFGTGGERPAICLRSWLQIGVLCSIYRLLLALWTITFSSSSFILTLASPTQNVLGWFPSCLLAPIKSVTVQFRLLLCNTECIRIVLEPFLFTACVQPLIILIVIHHSGLKYHTYSDESHPSQSLPNRVWQL